MSGQQAKQQVQAQAAAKDQQQNQQQENEGADQQEEEEQEEKVRVMADDEFYPLDHVQKQIPDSQISRRFTYFHGCFGQDSFRRYNLHYLDNDTIIQASGVTMQILNLKTNERQTLFSKDQGGIGSIAVHPSRKFYAVAEKGQFPQIYIYSYPDNQVYRILRKGTERAYSHIIFSADGQKLASVGSNPDFMLTVWEWKAEKVILRAKAFSQDIFRVAFSPYVQGQLITSGTGHIRFWKMARTFTGLKLQGDIGKFGQLELSDVSGFAQMPDGKVLCGTESGTLLLWEGNLVKAQLISGDGQNQEQLHKGMIEVVLLEGGTLHAPEEVLTAGADGFIRYWDFNQIDNAQADETPNVVINMKKQIKVESRNGEVAYIVDMIKGDDHWLIQDGNGRLYKMPFATDQVRELHHFHSGPLRGLAVPKSADVALTLGNDGRVKLWDFISRKQVATRDFQGHGRCIDYMPYNMTNKDRVFACGYENGLVRVIALSNQSFTLLSSCKPHDSPVKFVKYAPDTKLLMSIAEDSSIFFQHLQKPDKDVQGYDPLCLFKLQSSQSEEKQVINDVCWHNNSNKILIGTKSGKVYQITAPKPEQVDNTESYQVQLQHRSWTIRMMEEQMKKFQKTQQQEKEQARQKRMAKLRGQAVEETEQEQKEWEPAPILAVKYLQMPWVKNSNKKVNSQFILSADGPYNGFLYVCQFQKQRPLKTIKASPNTKTIYINQSPSGDFLVTGCMNGSFQIRAKGNATTINDLNNYMELRPHDMDTGKLTGIQFTHDQKYVLSAAEDGVLFSYFIDKEGTLKSTQAGQRTLEPKFEDPRPAGRLLDALQLDKQTEKLQLTRPIDQDVQNPSEQLSIQEAKLKTQQNNKLSQADTKKQKMRQKIVTLRQKFNQLVEDNKKQPEHLRLDAEFFDVDQQYFSTLQEQHMNMIGDVEKQVAWDKEWYRMKLQKLEDQYYNKLMYKRYAVKAIKTTSFVNSIRLEYMNQFLQDNLDHVKRLLEKQQQGKSTHNDFLAAAERGGHGDGMNSFDGTGGIMSETQSQKGDDGAGGESPEQAAAAATGGHAQQRNSIQQPGQKKKSAAEIKREERKIARDVRKAEMEKLEKQDPSKNEANPEDKKAIENAKRSFGDYKLKSADNYIVPENERVNCQKKKQQMIILQSSIHNLKEQFNQKVVGLRDRKAFIIRDITEKNQRIKQINKQLEIEQELFVPKIDDAIQNPDAFFDVTDTEIIKFVRQRAIKEREKSASKNLFGGSKKKGDDDVQEIMLNRVFGELAAQGGQKPVIPGFDSQESMIDQFKPVERLNKRIMESQLEEEVNELERMELNYQKKELIKSMDEMIADFDRQIKQLAYERLKLLSDLKNAEMKLIQYYQELLLLHGMESRDQQLSERLVSCMNDKGQIVKEISEISRKLRDKKEEIQRIQAMKQQNMQKFKQLIPETTPNYDQIFAFFTKKVKRRRKQEKRKKNEDDDQDDDDDQNDSDEDNDDDDDFDDDQDDQEDEEDNEQALKFNQQEHKIDDVDRLREQRLDIIDQGQKIQKVLDQLDQQRKICENKQKEVDKRLKDTLDEIHVFQRDKMRRLNQIEVCVCLALDQVQNLEPDEAKLEFWANQRNKEIQNRLQSKKLPHGGAGSRADSRSQMDSQSHGTSLSVSRTGRGQGMGAGSSFALEQMQEHDDRGYFLPKTLSESILFTQDGINELLQRINDLNQEIKQFMQYHRELRLKKGETNKKIKSLRQTRKVREEKYKENQMLRFGDYKEIDALETQGPSQTVRQLTAKFAKTEKKCIKLIQEADADLQKTKQELSETIQQNTTLLSLLTDLGRENLSLNKKLDSTNKRIFVDDDVRNRQTARKYQEQTKQLLQLQQREIDTLKAEISLFKRKGGHIYTTVTTNRRVAAYSQPQGQPPEGYQMQPMDDSQMGGQNQ